MTSGRREADMRLTFAERAFDACAGSPPNLRARGTGAGFRLWARGYWMRCGGGYHVLFVVLCGWGGSLAR